MSRYLTQIEKYDELYKDVVYTNISVPDLKIINNRIVSGKKILILGAGTARDTKFLIKNNTVFAIDYSSEAVKFLKNLGIRAFKSDLNKRINFKEKSFDIIIAKDILEHLENPSILGFEIQRLLKTDGYAVINIPNHFFLPMRLRIMFGKNLIWKTIDHNHTKQFKEWDYMHIKYFTWKGFQEFLKVHKFKIVKNYWDFGTLNHYSQPEMALEYFKNKNKYLLTFLKAVWGIFNFIFPRSIRSFIVSLSPSLFCASFYVWVKVKK